jgi:hypothetical protein
LDKLGIAALAIAVAGLGLSLWQIMSLRRRLDGALSGEQGNLEERLTTYFTHIDDTDRRMKELAEHYLNLSASAALASQKISVVRFNPFGDTGGDQSFVLAVLDSHNSGYVLTSIHGREGTRVYVKPIDYSKSKYTLSKEEQQAITQATKRVPMFKEDSDGKS